MLCATTIVKSNTNVETEINTNSFLKEIQNASVTTLSEAASWPQHPEYQPTAVQQCFTAHEIPWQAIRETPHSRTEAGQPFVVRQ